MDLGGESLGNSGAYALASALEGNTELKELHLANCGIGHDGALAIARALGLVHAMQCLIACIVLKGTVILRGDLGWGHCTNSRDAKVVGFRRVWSRTKSCHNAINIFAEVRNTDFPNH